MAGHSWTCPFRSAVGYAWQRAMPVASQVPDKTATCASAETLGSGKRALLVPERSVGDCSPNNIECVVRIVASDAESPVPTDHPRTEIHLGAYTDTRNDRQLIDEDGVWVPCRICEDVFRRLRLTARYCATCNQGFCEGEHGSFGPTPGRGRCLRH